MRTFKILFGFLAFTLFCLSATAQTSTPPTTYYIVDYMKAAPGHSGDYVRLEKTVWKDLHKARIKKGGSEVGWWFLEVRMPSGANTEYDYVAISAVSGWNGIDSLYNSWTDLFGSMTKEQAKHVDSTGMFRTLVRSEICVDPATGKVLWTCDARGDTVSPVLAGGLVYIDSGRGGPGLAVDPTGTGDVTKTHVRWKLGQVPEGYSSPVAAGGFLFRLHAPETLRCVKLGTGETAFTERLPGVQSSCSPIATPDGRVYCASAGKSYVLKAGAAAEILAVNDLADPGPASPAVADGALFLKGRRFLFCVRTKE